MYIYVYMYIHFLWQGCVMRLRAGASTGVVFELWVNSDDDDGRIVVVMVVWMWGDNVCVCV